MGNIECLAISFNSIKFFHLSAQLTSLAGGLALGIILILVIIIAGFIVYKMMQKNDNYIDEDRSIGNKRGIVRRKDDQ